MKNILIPTDFSDNAWNAVVYANQFFKNENCNFYLLHVSDFLDYASVPVSVGTGENSTEQKTIPAKKKLSDLIKLVEKTFSNEKHQYFVLQDHGFFIESIKKHLSENKIDLIVMGTKGAAGIRKRIIGSNTGDVITKVQCNALIVPEGVDFSKPDEVAFPTDYNIFYSHKILDALSGVLSVNKGKIRVMNVSKTQSELTHSQEKNKEYLRDFLNERFPERNSFHTITNKKVTSAIQCFVESREVDMIFMVAKNLNLLQQILFDSLVEKVSFHTTVPFFVVHE
ncbi:nucleotide-binding universal stress UspA family protein [Saonia flava]|uniref:Nucleotide-binding universal stress UspA family protein n=1 Tax=Saonia flava TaxID=523696 RepID=A0A846R489_9FLAO|nr:universal stress protein [Saonia flava]NJB72174.1 nucleotide-binding universal stress UspA family protein [Saonia flava]